MPEESTVESLRAKLTSLRAEVLDFYSTIGAQEAVHSPSNDDVLPQPAVDEEIDQFVVPPDAIPIDYQRSDRVWERLSPELQETAQDLARRIKKTMVQVSSLVRSSALLGGADLRDLGVYAKQMSAALRFRRYKQWGLYVHHDEDVVLGVDPPGQSEKEAVSPLDAHRIFVDAYRNVMEMMDLVSAADMHQAGEQRNSTYKPDTAFIMMQIDKEQPDLVDVLETVRQVFKTFGISARRADEIEHEDIITSRILDEIAAAEFLFADLTGERPSVYYEVGYAHAIKKRVILYRKKGTRIHFDLAHRNCPEYQNLAELRKLLHKRLAEMTGKHVPES